MICLPTLPFHPPFLWRSWGRGEGKRRKAIEVEDQVTLYTTPLRATSTITKSLGYSLTLTLTVTVTVTVTVIILSLPWVGGMRASGEAGEETWEEEEDEEEM